MSKPDEEIIIRMEAGEEFSDKELFPDLYKTRSKQAVPPWERAADAMDALM